MCNLSQHWDSWHFHFIVEVLLCAHHMKAIVKPASMEDLFRWIMIFFFLKLMKTGIKMFVYRFANVKSLLWLQRELCQRGYKRTYKDLSLCDVWQIASSDVVWGSIGWSWRLQVRKWKGFEGCGGKEKRQQANCFVGNVGGRFLQGRRMWGIKKKWHLWFCCIDLNSLWVRHRYSCAMLSLWSNSYKPISIWNVCLSWLTVCGS